MKYLITLLLGLLYNTILAQQTHLLFKTNYGNFKVMLYDFTPQHKALILDQINKGTYKRAFFNRVVEGFVVQGGNLDETILKKEKRTGISKGRLAPEFDVRAYHKIGALGAGRDNNASKSSYLNQIYFVVGNSINPNYFDTLQTKYNKSFSQERKNDYLNNGGLPRLDNDYTVFGEVIEGLDVLLKIAQLPSNKKSQKPLKKIKFNIQIID